MPHSALPLVCGVSHEQTFVLFLVHDIKAWLSVLCILSHYLSRYTLQCKGIGATTCCKNSAALCCVLSGNILTYNSLEKLSIPTNIYPLGMELSSPLKAARGQISASGSLVQHTERYLRPAICVSLYKQGW